MLRLRAAAIPGCYEVLPHIFDDERGRLVKVFQEEVFRANGLCTSFMEEFYSHSTQNVVRGLHFQAPPAELVKLVYCVAGEALDAVVDLRRGSPTYGEFAVFRLSAACPTAVYIPTGVAHGFCAISAEATLVYMLSKVYAPEYDAGIRWNSAGIQWPVAQPIVSSRDSLLPALRDFESPFVYD